MTASLLLAIAHGCSKSLAASTKLFTFLARPQCYHYTDRLVPYPVQFNFTSLYSQCSNNSVNTLISYHNGNPLNQHLVGKRSIHNKKKEDTERCPLPKLIKSNKEYNSVNTLTSYFNVNPWNRLREQRKRDVYLVGERSIHNEKKEDTERRPLPKLIYMHNPISWLAYKLDFRLLKRQWDEEFDEQQFRRGTKQAISTVTNMISHSNYAGLKRLMTRSSLAQLRREVETVWSDEKRRNVGLHPDDIQVIIPRKIHFHRVYEQKFCDVDMVFLALKWAENEGIRSNTILYMEVISRFHREYTEGKAPDWTISLFRVTKFKAVPAR